MDAKALYWTGAWLNMGIVVLLAWSGVRQIPARRYDRHRSRMLAAVALVGLFVVSYALKLAFLGREALETWTPAQRWVLRAHETCVFVMLVGGGIALRQALRLGLPLDSQDAAHAGGVRLHRRAGFVALAGATLGVLTAAYVLLGMYARAS